MSDETPDYIWPSPSGEGWVDAWNGWYETKAEALVDAAGGVGTPWVLSPGEDIITEEAMEQRRAARLTDDERADREQDIIDRQLADREADDEARWDAWERKL